MCADWGSNPQPWRIGTTLRPPELHSQGWTAGPTDRGQGWQVSLRGPHATGTAPSLPPSGATPHAGFCSCLFIGLKKPQYHGFPEESVCLACVFILTHGCFCAERDGRTPSSLRDYCGALGGFSDVRPTFPPWGRAHLRVLRPCSHPWIRFVRDPPPSEIRERNFLPLCRMHPVGCSGMLPS